MSQSWIHRNKREIRPKESRNINKRVEAWVVIPLQEISCERDKIFKSSGFFRIEYVLLPLEKRKLGYAARREFRVWAIFQPGLLVSRFTPGGFSINFSSLVNIYVYIEATNHTLIISFPELKISIIFPILVSFSIQLSFFSLTLTFNTFFNF